MDSKRNATKVMCFLKLDHLYVLSYCLTGQQWGFLHACVVAKGWIINCTCFKTILIYNNKTLIYNNKTLVHVVTQAKSSLSLKCDQMKCSWFRLFLLSKIKTLEKRWTLHVLFSIITLVKLTSSAFSSLSNTHTNTQSIFNEYDWVKDYA